MAAPWPHGKGEVEFHLRAIPVRSFIQDRAVPLVVELHFGSGNPALELQGREIPLVERGGQVEGTRMREGRRPEGRVI